MAYDSSYSIAFYNYSNSVNFSDEIVKLKRNQVELLDKYASWKAVEEYKRKFKTTHVNGKMFNGISIIDGIKCTIGEETINHEQLNARNEYVRVAGVVNELISELLYTVYIVSCGHYDEYRSRVYGELDTVLKSISDDSTEYKFITDMDKAKVALPASLCKYYNSCMLEKYREFNLNNDIKNCCDVIGVADDIKEKIRVSELRYIKECKEYIVKNKNADEELYKKVVRTIVEFGNAYYKLNSTGKTNLRAFVDSRSGNVWYITTEKGERLATKTEAGSVASGAYKRKVYYIDFEKGKDLCLFGWAVLGDNKYLRESMIPLRRTDEEQLVESLEHMCRVCRWLSSEEFQTEDLPNLVRGLKGPEYKENADDSVKEGSLVEIVDYILENVDESKSSSYTKIAISIAKDCKEKKRYKVSEKQLKVLTSVYRQEKGIEKPKENLFNEQIEKKCKFILASGKTNSFEEKVAESVVKYKRCSEKQARIIVDSYNNIFSKSDSNVRIDAIGGCDNSLFIDDAEQEQNRFRSTENDEMMFESDTSNEFGTYTGEANDGFSIRNISDMIGGGDIGE